MFGYESLFRIELRYGSKVREKFVCWTGIFKLWLGTVHFLFKWAPVPEMGFINHVPSLPGAEKGQVNKRKEAKIWHRNTFLSALGDVECNFVWKWQKEHWTYAVNNSSSYIYYLAYIIYIIRQLKPTDRRREDLPPCDRYPMPGLVDHDERRWVACRVRPLDQWACWTGQIEKEKTHHHEIGIPLGNGSTRHDGFHEGQFGLKGSRIREGDTIQLLSWRGDGGVENLLGFVAQSCVWVYCNLWNTRKVTSHSFSDCSSDQGTFKKAKWQLGPNCPSSYSTLKTSIASRILTPTGAS